MAGHRADRDSNVPAVSDRIMTPEEREIGKKVYEARISAFRARQIADKLNAERLRAGEEPMEPSWYWNLGIKYMRALDREDAEEMKMLLVGRIDLIFNSLQRGILSGNPRSAEVGLKAVDSLREMFGFTAAGQLQQNSQPNQLAVVINIAPHPDDPTAARIIAEQGQPAPLRSPAPRLLLPAQDHGPGGGDGLGEDVDGAPVVLEAPDRRGEGDS
jgi:hypothetical protein